MVSNAKFTVFVFVIPHRQYRRSSTIFFTELTYAVSRRGGEIQNASHERGRRSVELERDACGQTRSRWRKREGVQPSPLRAANKDATARFHCSDESAIPSAQFAGGRLRSNLSFWTVALLFLFCCVNRCRTPSGNARSEGKSSSPLEPIRMHATFATQRGRFPIEEPLRDRSFTGRSTS
jgi:hypothetical protein